MKIIEKWRKYWRIARADEIVRRYFTLNSFDGVLTTIGLLAGMFVAGVTDGKVITTAAVSTGIAIGLSGFWGAFLSETAERKKKLRELEKSLMRKLENTEISRASVFASRIIAIVDGASPLLASLVVVSPFFFTPVSQAYYYSFALSGAALLALGAFLGSVSGEDKTSYALKMLLAGVLAAGVSFLLL